MKRLLILLGGLILAGGAVGVGCFVLVMKDSFDFAQNQALLGRAYMDGMRDEDCKEVAAFSLGLMLESQREGRSGQMSEHDDKPVPVQWQKRGVIFIRYRADWVSFGWHGGPHAHTQLEVRRDDDGALVLTAHYTDHEPDRVLREIPRAQQACVSGPSN